MKKFINCTPHAIVLNDGRIFEPSGIVARVDSFHDSIGSDVFKHEFGDIIFCQEFGEIIGLPEQTGDTIFIVSAIVLSASKVLGRTDCVAPATGHPEVKRNDK